jgi:hypothetical protein
MVQFVPLNITRASIPADQPWDQQVLFMHTNTLKYYPDETKFGPQAFQLFQHTPYLIADDDYPTIFYSDEGRFCIEFATFEKNGVQHKPVTVKFKDVLPDFATTYQYMINKVHADDYGLN